MNSIQGIGAVSPGVPAGALPVDPHAQARNLQKLIDRELDGIPSQIRLNVRLDADARRIVVQVVDVESGDVLRQIPREEALVLAREMARQSRVR